MVAFRNPVDRFVAEWGELLDLGTARRQHYLSSAAICLDRALGTKVLGLMEARQHLVDFERTHWRQGPPDYPFAYADQDIFNAVLATRVEPDRIVALDQRLAPTPPFTRPAAWSTNGPCAAPTRTRSSPTWSTITSSSPGSSPPTTASTRSCFDGC